MSRFMSYIDPIGSKLVASAGLDPTINVEKRKKEAAVRDAAAAAAAGASSVKGIQRARGLKDRQGRIESAAVAAGAVRSENEADVLGAANNFVPKKKASKDLLGGG